VDMEIQLEEPEQLVPQKTDFLTKIIKNEKHNSIFKEASTILEVVNESINNSLKVTPDHPSYDTALFGAILKQLQLMVHNDKYDHTGAYILLFQYILQKVNPSVKQSSIGAIEKALDQIIKNVPKNTIPEKYIISMYFNILQVKPPVEWKKESTQKMFNYILEALDCEKMALRKKASKCMTALVEHGLFKVSGMDFLLQNYFLNYIKSSHQNPKQTIYILFFLNGALKSFPSRIGCDIAHNLVLALKNEEISIELATHIYSTIESLLAAKPLSSDLVEGWLKEFIHNPPHLIEDSNLNFAYLQCLAQTILHLHSVDPVTSKGYISSCISACSEYLLSQNSKLASLACKSIELIINHTITKSIWFFGGDAEDTLESYLGINTLEIQEDESKGPTTFQKITSILKYLLQPQFQFVQKYVSNILTTFFDRLDHTCPDAAKDLIIEWIDNKEGKQLNIWSPVVGKFIQKVDLEFILKTYPLRVLETDISSETYEKESNSWILPVLRKYLRIDSIKFFLEYFLPVMAGLDDYLYTKPIAQWTQVEVTLEMIYNQIWEIFPRFCKFTKENVPFIEQIYDITTKVLGNRPKVRKHVCQGLEILCSYFFKLPKFTNAQMRGTQETLTSCSVKLMPKLCAMFMKEALESKNVIKLIRTLAGLCSKKYLEDIYLKHINKILGEKLNGRSFTHIHIKECDILIAMAGSIELSSNENDKYELTKKFIRAFLSDKAGFQKRAFKLLEILSKKVHSSFLPEMLAILDEIQLVETSSKLGKLSCILTILEKMEYSVEGMEEIVQIVQKIMPEVLIVLKESNKKARKVAINIIKFLAGKFQEHEAASLFASLVTAGLAAKTSLMKSATILGMAQVIKESHAGDDPNFVWETTSIVLLMIKEKNREIFKAVIQFLKAYMKVTPKPELQKNLQNILVPLFEWDEDGRDQNKLMLRYLIEKLIRKLGRNVVEEAIPGEHKKLIKYITKQEKLTKKKREEKRAQYQMHMEEMIQDKAKKIGRTLEENEDDEYEERQFADQQMGSSNAMEVENNNLLLKFDTLREKFHFVEHPIAKIKEKQKKEEELAKNTDNDVIFNDQTGKIIINEEDITGKKRRGDTRFGEHMAIEDEQGLNREQPRTIRKVVRISQERAIAKAINPEEQKVNATEFPQRRKSIINKKIIGDVKIFNSETLNPTAYIPINPKILNKRNRLNAPKAFEFLISKKKTGSLAGLKSKMKS